MKEWTQKFCQQDMTPKRVVVNFPELREGGGRWGLKRKEKYRGQDRVRVQSEKCLCKYPSQRTSSEICRVLVSRETSNRPSYKGDFGGPSGNGYLKNTGVGHL